MHGSLILLTGFKGLIISGLDVKTKIGAHFSEGCMDEDDGESLPDVKPPTVSGDYGRHQSIHRQGYSNHSALQTSTTSTQTKAIEEDPSALDTVR